MKKVATQSVYAVLHRYGKTIINSYELTHRDFKYSEAVNEIYNFFSEIIFKETLPKNDLRLHFLSKLYGTQISEALYIIYYLHKAIKLDGDVCEFGCANGATSALLANELHKTKKRLWLYDSFEGLSKPTKEDTLINDMFNLGSMKKYQGTMSYTQKEVRDRLKETKYNMDHVQIIEGFIDKTIKDNNIPESISFSYIDFDLYKPIAETLQVLEYRITKGGYIIVDDYGFFSSGVKLAVDNFLKKRTFQKIMPYKFAGYFCILQKI